MSEKIYTYHTSHSFKREGLEISMVTQLYQIGIYAIINNKPSLQFTFEPKKIVSIEKALNKDLKSGKISDLVFGREIKVAEIDGLWNEVN